MVHHRRAKIHGFKGGRPARTPVAKARTHAIVENRAQPSRAKGSICERFAGGRA
jgi:hypothetical protein